MFQSLRLKDFMLFQKADFRFGTRLNVVIGENGSGKTQLLKLLYALGKITASGIRIRLTGPKQYVDYRHKEGAPKDEVNGPLKGVFNVEQTCDLIHLDTVNGMVASSAEIVAAMQSNEKSSTFHITIDRGMGDYDSNDFSGETVFKREPNLSYSPEISTETLFFQSREVLSIYKGFRSLNDKYHLPYDLSVTDTISKLGMPNLKASPKEYEAIIKELEAQIQGEIYLDNEQFHFRPTGMPKGSKHAWSVEMAAEGWRKLGMLLQVLKNGELHRDMTLLWDEPEANLNPQLIRLIAMAIVQLSQLGIQVVMTTHSLFLLRELSMLVKSKKKPGNAFEKGSVRFFNFIGKGIVEQGDDELELGNVLLLEESLRQSDRYLLEDY